MKLIEQIILVKDGEIINVYDGTGKINNNGKYQSKLEIMTRDGRFYCPYVGKVKLDIFPEIEDFIICSDYHIDLINQNIR